MGEVRVFQALSDATRLEILSVLAAGPVNVSKIVAHLGCSQPAVSRHLRVLREASLISDKRKGKEVEYSLNPHVISAAVEHLGGLVTRVSAGAVAVERRGGAQAGAKVPQGPRARAAAGRGGSGDKVAGSRSGGTQGGRSGRSGVSGLGRPKQVPARAAPQDFTSKQAEFEVERKRASMDDFLL